MESGNIRALYLGSVAHRRWHIHLLSQRKGSIWWLYFERSVGKSGLCKSPRTLQKLKDMNLDIKAVVAGHFSSIHSPKIIDDYLTLLKNQDYQ
jgi:metallo-beta-lactamase class B